MSFCGNDWVDGKEKDCHLIMPLRGRRGLPDSAAVFDSLTRQRGQHARQERLIELQASAAKHDTTSDYIAREP